MPLPRQPWFPRCLLLAALLAAPLAAGRTPGCAVWSYRNLAGDAAERQAFFRFARQEGIGELYLGAAGLLPEGAPALEAFLQEAADRGIRVSLLLGRSAWTRTERQAEGLAQVRQVLAFARDLRRRGRPGPVSLQLDVEPHALPDWSSHWEALAIQYLGFLEAVQAELAGELPLWVDLPVWWDRRPVARQGRTQSLAAWVLDLADRGVLMDYRNRTARILASAEEELALAADRGKPVVLGLDTQCGDDPDNAATSFCRMGARALRRAMGEVDARLRGHRGYAGLAVFTYEDRVKLGR